MRKACGVICAMLVLASYSGLEALTFQRGEWWKRRNKTLSEQRAALLKKEPGDQAMIGLLDAEIRRAGEMLAEFDRAASGLDGRKTAVDAPMDEHMRRIAQPLVSLRILEYAVHAAGEKSRVERTRAGAEQLTEQLVASILGSPDDALTKALVAEISPTELRYITLERFFTGLMKKRETLRRKALDGIRARLEQALRGGSPGAGELAGEVLSASNEMLQRFPGESDFIETDEPLDSSATWREANARIKRVLSHIVQARGLLESENAGISPERMLLYLDHPAELDRRVFESAAKRYFDTTSMGAPSFTRTHENSKTYSMNIPKNPDGARMFAEIDSLRQNAAVSITGAETDAWFDSTKIKIDAVIEKYVREAREDFNREDELLRARRDEHGTVEVANEEDYYASRAVFREKLALVNGYALKSIEFLKYLRNARSLNGSEILAFFRERQQANGGFLLFLEDSLAGCEPCARIDSPRAHERYSFALRRIDTVCKTLRNASSLKRHHAGFLSAAQMREIKTEQKKFHRSLTSLKARIDLRGDAFARERKAADAARNEAEDKNRRGFATMELETMRMGIDDYYSYYLRLNHSAQAFPAYARRHAEIEKQLRDSTAPASLEKLLEKGTLLPVVTGFNSETIERERRSKSFLRQEIRAAISRLLTLSAAYRKKNVSIPPVPDAKRLDEVRGGIGRINETGIAGWTMNEENFKEIDRKAAHRLSKLAARLYWSRKDPSGGEPGAAVPVRLNLGECTVDLSIPGGWIELQENRGERSGAAKSFYSKDREVAITVALIPLDGEGAREAGLRWVKNVKNSVVKERWGKTLNADYHWSLLKGDGNLVTEVYTVRRGENACVVSGSAKKERYALLKPKIDAVFRSLGR